MTDYKTIAPNNLICMNDFAERYTYRVELAYAQPDNLLFGEQIYHNNAQLWLHKYFARIIFSAAQYCSENYGHHFVLYDGLRTIEAQEAMIQTRRAQRNPHWTEPPRLLAVPGAGGHPRGMAIDIGLVSPNGEKIDMGTEFDHMAKLTGPEHNPAHRDAKHPKHIMKNREALNDSMQRSAVHHKTELILLSEEWWDFRLPREIYNQYTPISEQNLPEDMKLLDI